MTNPSGSTTYTYDDADRITEVQPPSPASAIAYTWDDNGNLVERGSGTFEWDYEDRMVSATVNSVTTTFAYRGDGLRDSRTVGMTTTRFTWDINAGLPVVLDDGPSREGYLYGAGLSAMKQSGNWHYYLADGLRSTMVLPAAGRMDAAGDVENGYTYDPSREGYGEPTVTGSLANEFDFAGQQTDPTGLQYLRARYYDPETGTFLSRDPLAALPSWLGSPFGYAYADPIGLSDPTGLDSPWDGVRKRANPCNWEV
ncbi:MAG: RHS repeat-associated core domain-containing protein [Dehalococcoidia bacterium]|nr:RHS repeat-associated core domain-containing protein [Dehalococcoidia bacterium]